MKFLFVYILCSLLLYMFKLLSCPLAEKSHYTKRAVVEALQFFLSLRYLVTSSSIACPGPSHLGGTVLNRQTQAAPPPPPTPTPTSSSRGPQSAPRPARRQCLSRLSWVCFRFGGAQPMRSSESCRSCAAFNYII